MSASKSIDVTMVGTYTENPNVNEGRKDGDMGKSGIGPIIDQRITDLGMTNVEVAKLAGIGEGTVRNVRDHGTVYHKDPSFRVLDKIAVALGLDRLETVVKTYLPEEIDRIQAKSPNQQQLSPQANYVGEMFDLFTVRDQQILLNVIDALLDVPQNGALSLGEILVAARRLRLKYHAWFETVLHHETFVIEDVVLRESSQTIVQYNPDTDEMVYQITDDKEALIADRVDWDFREFRHYSREPYAAIVANILIPRVDISADTKLLYLLSNTFNSHLLAFYEGDMDLQEVNRKIAEEVRAFIEEIAAPPQT